MEQRIINYKTVHSCLFFKNNNNLTKINFYLSKIIKTTVEYPYNCWIRKLYSSKDQGEND